MTHEIKQPHKAVAVAAFLMATGIPVSAQAAELNFCYRFAFNEDFWDASPAPHDTGTYTEWEEDYGRNDNSVWKAKYVYAKVLDQNEETVWGPGYLNADGCTGPVSTNGEYFAMGITSWAAVPAGTSTNYAHGLNCQEGLSTCENNEPVKWIYPVYPWETTQLVSTRPTWRIFWALMYSMYRSHVGLTGEIYHVYYDNDGDGTASNYDIEDEPTIRVKGDGSYNKFTVAHEYGHLTSAIARFRLNQSDLDYSYDDPKSEHFFKSEEYQHAAALEGYGHFQSAITWNDFQNSNGGKVIDAYESGEGAQYALEKPWISVVLPSGNAIFGSGTEDDYPIWETHASETYIFPYPNGLGNETDWMAAFWDYRTDPGSYPLVRQIAAMFATVYPWPIDELTSQYYNDMENAATHPTRFQDVADRNGVNW